MKVVLQTKMHLNLRKPLQIQHRLNRKENYLDLLRGRLLEKKNVKNEQLNAECLLTATGNSRSGCSQTSCCVSFIIPKRSSLISIFIRISIFLRISIDSKASESRGKTRTYMYNIHDNASGLTKSCI